MQNFKENQSRNNDDFNALTDIPFNFNYKKQQNSSQKALTKNSSRISNHTSVVNISRDHSND